MAKRVRAVDPWKLKRWYKIVAPRIWDEREVGETAASDEKLLYGRTVEIPASMLTGSIGHAQYLVRFQIRQVVGSEARTEFVGYELDRAFIKRLTRRHSSKVEHVFDVTTRDGHVLHVKAITWTAVKISNPKKTAIRKIMQEMIEDRASKLGKDELMKEFIIGDLTQKIAAETNKIAPTRRVEVAKVRVVSAPSEEAKEAVAEATA
ncbi:MAG: small subunit ribosomal protein S3Ae [Candidatus Diapherotrites archaeon]|nr:small subunit ribosomal protein S3Ae [Candidatus Diapherotrites archaeon]MDN5367005.1 small subunit ribosomal protein S3Ae [Candidatus Diapherotrites archaeon]